MNDTCTVTLTFTPQVAGMASLAFRVSGGPGGNVSATAHGVGLATSVIRTSPAAHG